MPPKYNPKGLNPLQLRTLAILQRLATLEPHVAAVDDASGAVTLWNLPHAHGDHFHVGDAVLRTRDASGLHNPSVWAALARKGLIEGEFPHILKLKPDGRDYATGDLGLFMEHSDH